uniref:Reverse transcriptase domain-containing protein n=1 Tax=Fagus sylvatica TaxID=28930 RepID=A0A2N9HA28_FAGSY
MSSTACIKWIKIGSPSFKPTLIVGLLLASSQVDCTNPCIASLIFLALDLVIGPSGTSLYDEVAPVGEALLAKPVGIPLPKWEEIKDASETDLRDLLELKRKRREEASTNKSQPQICKCSGICCNRSQNFCKGRTRDPELVAHSLNVEPGTRPVVQPMKTFHSKVKAQITQEVKKLLAAGFTKPIQHPWWLSNIIPVKKKNSQICYCVDFRNLNKACPKDESLLPNMDLLSDSAVGHAMFFFMDGFSGYNQIFMSPKDAEKTAFRTPIGNFYYTVMPFSLKNAGATYQKTMTAMFHDMIHREIEDYVNDIVVKSKTREDHFGILKKVFERCRLYKLKMNPLKCAFGVSAGKFLGFLVHYHGIDVDPGRASAIATMKSANYTQRVEEFLEEAVIYKKVHSWPYCYDFCFCSTLEEGSSILLKLEAKFNTFEIEHAQRNENRYANALATLRSQIAFKGEEMDVTICKKTEPITELLKKKFEELFPSQEDWRAPIKAKLMSPAVVADLREIKDYTLIFGDLYRRLPGGVLARCISMEEVKKKLLEVHEKTCGVRRSYQPLPQASVA